jgi:hypothetical protein
LAIFASVLFFLALLFSHFHLARLNKDPSPSLSVFRSSASSISSYQLPFFCVTSFLSRCPILIPVVPFGFFPISWFVFKTSLCHFIQQFISLSSPYFYLDCHSFFNLFSFSSALSIYTYKSHLLCFFLSGIGF